MATSQSPPLAAAAASAAMGVRRSTRMRRQVQSIYDVARAESLAGIAEDGGKINRKKRTKRASLLPIYNIPESVLLHITSFVEDASKLLLAVALTASSDKIRKTNYDIKPCPAARLILGHTSFSCVKFNKFDKNLAALLSDEDVGGVLACLLDVSPLCSVELTNLVNVTGKCLFPLCRSADKLKTLDLSLVADDMKASHIQPESKLSKVDVIPILDRLLDSGKSDMLYIIFPKKWKKEGSQLLARFLAKYNRVMKEREIVCNSCEKNFCGTGEKSYICKTVGETFGTYNITCFCYKHSFCDGCAEEMMQELCQKCDQRYCTDCFDTMQCDLCHETTCWDCTSIDTCEACHKTTCRECLPVPYRECCERVRCLDCVPLVWCDHPECNVWSNCVDCADGDYEYSYMNIKYCPVCDVSYCGEHLMKRCFDKDSEDLCSGCEARALLNLAEDNADFGKWVQELEDKYSVKGRDCWTLADSLSHAIDAREELRKRCHAVGELLLPKQKKFERYESRLDSYESNLRW